MIYVVETLTERGFPQHNLLGDGYTCDQSLLSSITALFKQMEKDVSRIRNTSFSKDPRLASRINARQQILKIRLLRLGLFLLASSSRREELGRA